MSQSTISYRTSPALQRHQSRCGFAMADLVVGAVLLMSILAFLAPLAVRSGRLWQDTRRYRLAVDELTNQLETLTQTERSSLPQALETLEPSPEFRQRYPQSTLQVELLSDRDGTRLVLVLDCDDQGPARPQTLVGWIDGLPADDSTSQDSETEP